MPPAKPRKYRTGLYVVGVRLEDNKVVTVYEFFTKNPPDIDAARVKVQEFLAAMIDENNFLNWMILEGAGYQQVMRERPELVGWERLVIKDRDL